MSRTAYQGSGDVKLEHHKVKWDPKTLEIRTHSVEKALEPLVHQVTTLVNQPKKKGAKVGKSKNAHKLAQDIEDATVRLIKTGETIAQDFPEIREEMLAACKDCRGAGDTMRFGAKEFADDPCSSSKRANMIRAARALLSAVTRLLCVADMADVYRLLASLKLVERRLKDLEGVNNTADLLNSFKNLGNDLMDLAKLSGKRQADLKDPLRRDEMAAARAKLKDASKMLLSSSKAYVHHPDVGSAKANRDFVIQQMNEAVRSISGTAQATGPSQPHPMEMPGALAAALDDLDSQLAMDPASYTEKRTRPSLEDRLEKIISGAAKLADSVCTRDNTRDNIIAECNAVRQALQNLLSEYMSHSSGKKKHTPGGPLDQAIEDMCNKTRNLRGKLNQAVMDNISDAFLETTLPLLMMIEAAKAGNERETEECAKLFMNHAAKLEEVAELACSMSNNPEKVKMVRIAAKHIHALAPQVVNAARTLAARPHSQVALENMAVFKDAWEKQVRVLTEAVDDVTNIDDFLAASEAHILEDVNKCVQSLQDRDPESLDRTAGSIRGRAQRVDEVVTAEMENYQKGPYTDNVNRAVKAMREEVMPNFARSVEISATSLAKDPYGDHEEAKFVDASKLVYEGIRDIRRAVQAGKRGTAGTPPIADEDAAALFAEAQAKAREQAAYEQLKASGKVQFALRAEGGDDEGGLGRASILVNGTEYCPNKPGHNIVVLDPTGEIVHVKNFNTNAGQGPDMAKFLEELPDDHVVLVATNNVTGKEQGNNAIVAGKAFEKIGFTGDLDPGYKGSFAFAGCTGPKKRYWSSAEIRPRYRGPAIVAQIIPTPAAQAGQIKVAIVAEGADDPNATGRTSVKVNGVERSPLQRGHNVVILDNAGNFIMATHFDTADTTKGEGVKMARFIENIPKERMVLMATQGTTGTSVNDAKAALQTIGATGNPHPGFHASWAFVGYTGPEKVKWAKTVTQPRYKGPSIINEMITTPSAELEISQLESEQTFSDYEPVSDYEGAGAYSEYEETEDDTTKSLSKKSTRSLFRALPEAEKIKIAELAEGLNEQKFALERELTKWDEAGNEIIVLAKKMCMMMMEMSDFTRGTGPLKTTMDVIEAAKRIAKSGNKMTKLGTAIAERCPDSSSKNDLMAYIQRIALFSHQLTITSRVKADVQMISGELVVSGLDSATSLITAAKNLMNAVILTVKASYVASTKHKSGSVKAPVVQWHMRAPEKKPLVNLEAEDSRITSLQRSQQIRQESPIQALSEFDTSQQKRTRDFY
ncbi:catenin alpha-2-like [Actinia tenebrosa]|uniref:Catenin alpha-2-like n=1 Tax=Actinia tenebrosa TaxID=6105 RepID=A0A6P8IB19_ACTTE|nr:catenin alpha-2-like [Actinia tenebrosa]